MDATRLRELLGDYKIHAGTAKEKSELARTEFDHKEGSEKPGEIFWKGVGLVRESIYYLRMAYVDLREMVAEVRAQGYEIELGGTGALIARGDGHATIWVTGTVEVRAIVGGTMIVSEHAIVRAHGVGVKETILPGKIKYEGFGSAIVIGTDVEVEISGAGIDLLVAGEWQATLAGVGAYRVYTDSCTEGTWTETGTVVVPSGLE